MSTKGHPTETVVLGTYKSTFVSGSFGDQLFYTTAEAQVWVTGQQIVNMLAEKAARNKSKRATFLKGAVVVRLMNLTEGKP